MGYKIIPIPGVGRPEYSIATTIPISPSYVAGITKVYYTGIINVSPESWSVILPQDRYENPFPRKDKILKLETFVLSTDADVLIKLQCFHVPYYYYQKFLKGEIDLVTLLNNSYPFVTETGYQRIDAKPLLYPISYPDLLIVAFTNYSDATRTMYFYWRGEEHGL